MYIITSHISISLYRTCRWSIFDFNKDCFSLSDTESEKEVDEIDDDDSSNSDDSKDETEYYNDGDLL